MIAAPRGMSSEVWVRWRVRLGYPAALISFVLAGPTPRSLTIGAAIAALGLLVRGAAAGHLCKGVRLAISGPYAYTRNPLYLGSALLAAGFVVAGHSWSATALVLGYFAVFYPAVMRREEQELRTLYGAVFDDYAAHVPRFWPHFTHVRSSGSASGSGLRFSWECYSRNREYEALLGSLAGIGLLWLRMHWGG